MMTIQEDKRLREALEAAIDWYETMRALADGAPERGIKFSETYEPTWVLAAREALLLRGLVK